jgi:hypothetical protein
LTGESPARPARTSRSSRSMGSRTSSPPRASRKPSSGRSRILSGRLLGLRADPGSAARPTCRSRHSPRTYPKLVYKLWRTLIEHLGALGGVGTVGFARRCKWLNQAFDESQDLRLKGAFLQKAVSALVAVVGIGMVLGGVAVARSDAPYLSLGLGAVGMLLGACVIWVAWRAFFSNLIVTQEAIVLRAVKTSSCGRNHLRAIYRCSGYRGMGGFALVRLDWTVGLSVTSMMFSHGSISRLAAALGVPIVGSFRLPLGYQLGRDRDDAICERDLGDVLVARGGH